MWFIDVLMYTGAQCVAVLEAVDESVETGNWTKVERIE